MDASASVESGHNEHEHEHGHGDAHEHEHHELGFWRKYIFSTDHKVIGIQYGLCGLAFLFFGFCLMMIMRFQLAYPGQAMPVLGKWLPYVFGAGSPGMTVPKVNAASFWAFAVGGAIMFYSFFVPGGAAKSGWTSYVPLAGISDKGPGYNLIFNGQSLWLIGFIFLITSSLLGAINFITTIIQLRAKGLTWMRLPFFVWCQFVTAFLLLLAFPPLEAAIIMQLMDRSEERRVGKESRSRWWP